MAVAAFKSSSRKGTHAPSSIASTSAGDRLRRKDELGKNAPLRRSRSVSALARSVSDHSPVPSSNLPEYSNTIDNPLYGVSSSSSTSPDYDNGSDKIDGSGGRGGWTTPRTSDLGNQSSGFRKEPGRSLSRFDTGRRQFRSASRGRYESESEVDCGDCSSLSAKNKENLIGLSEKAQNLKSWTSQHPISETWDTSIVRQWDDGVSTYSFSEVEEATIREFLESDSQSGDVGGDALYETVRSEVRRAVSEIKHDLEMAVQTKSPVMIKAEDIAEISSELVNPEPLDIVSDARREYAAKLEQSQERARKLRADLAVEEQRKQELSRILKEMLPDSMTSTSAKKTRPRRKASIERHKMSRRLAQEALEYFGECVSISTFDGSEFSSQEDQPALGIIPTEDCRSLCNGSLNSSASLSTMELHHHEETDLHVQCSLSAIESDLSSSSSSSSSSNKSAGMIDKSMDHLSNLGTPQAGYSSFSAALDPAKSVGFCRFEHYIKNFHRNSGEDVEHVGTRASYNPDDYDPNMSAETLLFDKVIFKSRIQSGSLLICGNRQYRYLF